MKHSNFIKLLKNLPKQEELPKSFLEILKASHRENLISNLLAFYFDVNEEHGLKDLFLKALFRAMGEVYASDQLPEYDSPESIEVIRELTTDKNNRIDIVLLTSNWVIAIEHKINHQLNNPLRDYENFIYKEYSNINEKLFLVLTPIEKKSDEVGKFKTVLHERLFYYVRQDLGQYLPNLNQNNYLFYLLDFIHTMDNQKNEEAQELELVSHIQNDYEEVLEGYKKLKALEDQVRNRLHALRDVLEISNYSKREKPEVWNKDLEKVLYYKMKTVLDNKDLQLKFRLNPKGWSIEFWYVESSLDSLKKRLIVPENCELHYIDNKDYIILQNFEYRTDLDKIKSYIEDVLKRLFNS